MKLADIAGRVAAEHGLSQATAASVVNTVVASIADGIAEDSPCVLRNLGSFVPYDRKGGPGRDPRTGAAITLKPRRSVRFRAGKALRERLNPPQPAPRGRRRA